jgi:hypothetical protein
MSTPFDRWPVGGTPAAPFDQPTDLISVYKRAAAMNPVEAANALSAAIRLQASEAAAMNDPAGLHRAVRQPGAAYFQWMQENRPVTTRFLSNPLRMASAQDILDELNDHEGFFAKASKTLGRAWASGAEGIAQTGLQLERIVMRLFDLPLSVLIPAEGYDVMKDTGFGRTVTAALEESEQIARDYDEKMAKMGAGYKFAYRGFKGFFEMLPQIGVAMLTGGASAAPETGLMAQTVLATIKERARGMIPFAMKAFGSYAREAELDGADLPQQLSYAAWATIAETATEAPILTSYIQLFRAAGGMKAAAAGAQSLWKQFGQRAADWALTTLEQGLQEALVDPMAGEAKKLIYRPDMPAFGSGGVIDFSQMQEDFMGGVAMALVFSAAGMAGTASQALAQKIVEKGVPPSAADVQQLANQMAADGGPQVATPAGRIAREIGGAQVQAEIYKQAGQLAAASEHLKRSPEAFQEHIEAALGENLKTIYVEAGPLVQLLQQSAAEQNLDQDEAVKAGLAELGLTREQADEAAGTGQALPISFALWLAKVGPTPAYAKMTENVRFKADGLTLAQAAVEEQRVKAMVAEEEAKAKQITEEDEQMSAGFKAVYEDVKKKLEVAGRPKNISSRIWASYVDRMARLWAAHATTEAARRGISVEEWYSGNRQPTEIHGAEAARILRQAGGIEAELQARASESARRSDRSLATIFPELAPHIRAEANLILGEVGDVVKGERGHYTDPVTGEEINWGTRKIVSDSVQRIQDLTGASYQEIADALEAIRDGKPAADAALAKRIEIVIDENLTKGVERQGVGGRFDQEPNAEYLAAKQAAAAKGPGEEFNQGAANTTAMDNRDPLVKEWFGNWFDDPRVIAAAEAIRNAASNEEKRSLAREAIEPLIVDRFWNEERIPAVGARYGDAPESGRSFNTMENRYELGVSTMQVNDLPGVKSFAVAAARDNRGLKYYIGEAIKHTGGDDEVLMQNIRTITKKEYDAFVKSDEGILSSYALSFWLSDRDARLGLPERYPELWDISEGFFKKKELELAEMLAKKKSGQMSPANEPGSVLRQGPRGQVRITPSSSIVTLLANADASTFLHESAHIWLNDAFQFARSGQANEQAAADWATLAGWLGVKDDQAALTEAQHEQFAKGFEQYLLEGRAPSRQLQKVFSAIRRWLIRIYRTGLKLEVPMSDAVRGVMGRMLATDQAIQEAEALAGHNERAVTEADVTPETWAKLEELRAEAHNAAVGTLMMQHMEELSAARQAVYDERWREITASTEEEMRTEPVYAAQIDLQQRVGINPLRAAEEYRQGVMSEARRQIWDQIAEANGYGSGDALASDILANRPFAEEVRARTDERMKEHAGLLDADNIRQAAEEAIHNERREEVIAIENAILRDLVEQGEAGQRGRQANLERARIAVQAAREQAKKIMESKPHGAATAPAYFFAAEKNAAVGAAKAAAAGDKAKALQLSTQALVNHALAIEALRNREEVKKIWRQVERFTKRGQKMLNMPREFLNQIDAILERFGLAPAPELMPGETLEPLDSFLNRMKDDYDELPIPDFIRSGARRPAHEMTMGELRDLYAALRMLGAAGSRWGKFLTLFDRADVNEKGREARASIEAEVGTPRAYAKEIGAAGKNAGRKVAEIVDDLAGWLGKAQFICRFLDGGKDGGIMQRALIDPIRRAWNEEIVLHEQIIAGIRQVFGRYYTPKELARMADEKVHVDALGKDLTRVEIILAAANQGNDGNRQRFAGGYSMDGGKTILSDVQVMAILDKVREKDWLLVRDIGAFLETLWPRIKALEEEVTGVAPKKVEVAQVRTKYGIFDGWYFPIGYDPAKSSVAAAYEERLNALYKEMPGARAQTNHGHTKARAEMVNRPLKLDWSVLTRHLVNVAHDLSFRKAIIDANRFLRNQDVRTSVENAVGVEGYKALENWLKAIASDQGEAMDSGDKLLRWFRHKSTLFAMGFNLRLALVQPSGVFQGMAEIGALPTIRGIMKFAANPAAMLRLVKSKSKFMADAAHNFDRDIYSFARETFTDDKSLADYAYHLLSYGDQLWTIPTWCAAYQNKLAETGDEQAAIEHADGVIERARGSGATKDLSKFQRGPESKKILGLFYSYGNLLFNRLWLAGRMAGVRARRGQTGAAVQTIAAAVAYNWILPGVFEFAVRELLRQHRDDEEPEEFYKRLATGLLSGPLQTIPIVRDIGAFLLNQIMGQYGEYRMSPLESSIEDLGRTLARARQALIDRGEWVGAIEAGTKSFAYVAGISQNIVNFAWNVFDWIRGEGEADWRDIFSRRVR